MSKKGLTIENFRPIVYILLDIKKYNKTNGYNILYEIFVLIKGKACIPEAQAVCPTLGPKKVQVNKPAVAARWCLGVLFVAAPGPVACRI